MDGKVHKFMGLTVGVVVPGMDDRQKKEAYACDIVYGTNNELGFDYLRDNLKVSLASMVQRELNFCIIDEVDSILIDEARTRSSSRAGAAKVRDCTRTSTGSCAR